MGKLYIIGNGFDLHFGLHTKTDDFCKILERKESDDDEADNLLDLFNIYGIDWSSFEDKLSNINIKLILEKNLKSPDYFSDHEYDREGVVDNMNYAIDELENGIQNSLKEMALEANNQPLCPVLHFDSTDSIISFNYTSTVERVSVNLKSNQLFYIHGCAKKNENLILGYPKGEKEKKLSEISIEEEDDDGYISRQKIIIRQFYSSLEKEITFDNLNDFLEKCKEFDEIVVLGHSIGRSDYPYFEYLDKKYPKAKWLISYHDQNDKEKLTLNLSECNIKKYKFTTSDSVWNLLLDNW